MGALCKGAHQLGLRWKTVRWPAVSATTGISCTAVAPVPMTPTRLPARSSGSRGQSEVWKDGPRNASMPSIFGICGMDSGPTAVMSQRALARCPSSASTSHASAASSQLARTIRVSKRISRRRSNLSATWFT